MGLLWSGAKKRSLAVLFFKQKKKNKKISNHKSEMRVWHTAVFGHIVQANADLGEVEYILKG